MAERRASTWGYQRCHLNSAGRSFPRGFWLFPAVAGHCAGSPAEPPGASSAQWAVGSQPLGSQPLWGGTNLEVYTHFIHVLLSRCCSWARGRARVFAWHRIAQQQLQAFSSPPYQLWSCWSHLWQAPPGSQYFLPVFLPLSISNLVCLYFSHAYHCVAIKRVKSPVGSLVGDW